jgi:hypothetical protein
MLDWMLEAEPAKDFDILLRRCVGVRIRATLLRANALHRT